MKNEKIIDSWNKIEPDEETKQKIFGDIIKKQYNKRPKFKRIMLVAAVMTGVLILMSATAVVIYYHEAVYYDMKGNKIDMSEVYLPHSEYGSEEFRFEQALRENKAEDEILFIIFFDYESRNNPTKKIYDYNELINYLNDNGAEQLILPEYITYGYEFEHADVHLGLIGDIDYEEFESVYYEEKYGNIYEIYKLPEDKTCVENINLHYHKNEREGYISIIINFIWSCNSETISFGSPGIVETEPESLDMPQFKHSLIMSDKISSGSNPTWRFRAVKIIDKPVNILNAFFISKIWYEKNSKNFAFDTFEFDAVSYDINSSSVSRDEIIKIAESIK
ncbi:MAG: hypothetical protein FWF92_04595 [Oscillospiraceae bacterium]|nr:hypothetical protein [Oscillospiraceae bacterium]